MIIKGFMTTVEYHGRGNVLAMTKVKSAPDSDEE
jgi:hypothetical protein